MDKINLFGFAMHKLMPQFAAFVTSQSQTQFSLTQHQNTHNPAAKHMNQALSLL